ncbi:MAG: putative ABC transport system permease protein [Halieaceae bacterium]|jgi:putative ABC transport system permease protein
MFRNYLLTAWRNILANRLFSFINILGLTLGLASCILIVLFVREEISHDQDLPNVESIVRLHSAYRPADAPPFLTVRSAGRMMAAISAYAPEQVQAGVRLAQFPSTVTRDDAIFNENLIFADGSFFDVFELPWVGGSAAQSFSKPMDLVISERIARKYFGRTDVVGEVLTICCMPDKPIEVKIAGVIGDFPATSHLEIDFLLKLEESMFDFAPNVLATWNSVNVYTYFKLFPGTTASDLKERVWHWMDTESPFLERVEEGTKPTDIMQPNVMPVSDIYLHARRDAGNLGDLRPLGDITMVYAFIGITLLVLIIASVNFMNLSTARASKRAREVALRKVLGATRGQIAMQFLGEAIAVAFIALLLALALVELCLPLYNDAIGRALELSLGSELPLLFGLIVTTLLLGLFSGSYPAAYLSRFLPARILRSRQSGDDANSLRVRSALVVLQFALSICLGICTAVIYAQTHYAKTMDVGYNVENRLVIHGADSSAANERRDALQQGLLRVPGVRSVVFSSEAPSQDNENNTRFWLLDGAQSEAATEGVALNIYSGGFDFFESYDMEILAGRGFARQFVGDQVRPLAEGDAEPGQAGIVLNESAVRRLGLGGPQEAIGKMVRGQVFQVGTFDLTIVGVARDVYFRSIKHGIRPTAFLNNPGAFREVTVNFEPGADIRRLRADVESVWKDLIPMTPINYEFLSAMVSAQYEDEERQATLFAAFSLLAILIACLGLYGLASFTTERRTGEIGIRKVLGARVIDIVRLLVWQFSRPVLLANIVAWPAAWVLMRSWLEGFQYRIGGVDIVILCIFAGLLSLLIAWATVAGWAIKVAQANPITALRHE